MWLINQSLCLYHKNWNEETENEDIEVNLFSAFFTAFQAFQTEVFPNQIIKHIDLLNERLVINITPLFSLIVRDQIEKPLERSIMQIENISSELIKSIEAHGELYTYFLGKTSKIIPIPTIEENLSPVIEGVIEMISMAELQINKFDIITVLQIMREVRDLILQINDDRIFNNFARDQTSIWFYELLFSDENIELSAVPSITYKELKHVIEDFIKQTNDSLTLYGNSNKSENDCINFHNRVITFLAVNTSILKKFGILESILTGPLRHFKLTPKNN